MTDVRTQTRTDTANSVRKRKIVCSTIIAVRCEGGLMKFDTMPGGGASAGVLGSMTGRFRMDHNLLPWKKIYI